MTPDELDVWIDDMRADGEDASTGPARVCETCRYHAQFLPWVAVNDARLCCVLPYVSGEDRIVEECLLADGCEDWEWDEEV